jgi:6-pyruvoyltetrahydropterin/6-carboxytetrahydropterin synthase
MYTVAVKRDFVAQHYLIGGEWGAENEWHSHHYVVEVQLHGRSLDSHGYLVDIVDIEHHLDALVAYYQDKTLNDLSEFMDPRTGEALNPSIEHFSRLFCQQLASRIKAGDLSAITLKIWENDIAWASYQMAIAA